MGARAAAGALMFAALSWPAAGRANPEPVALYDARSAAMGGTGLAFIDSGSAIFHNPANLELIDRLAATITLTPFYPVIEAPFAEPGTDGPSIQEDNSGRVAPLFFLGVAGRPVDPVTLGLGAYIFSGIGSRFGSVDALGDQSMDLQFAAGELTLPVAVRITDELSMGLAVRLLYAFQQTDVYDPSSLVQGRVRQELDGLGFPGFRLGVLYRPTRSVSLAFTYRSRVAIDLDGQTDIETPLLSGKALPTDSEWVIPHAFRLGAAYRLLEGRLLLAFEMKAQFHREANDTQVYAVDVRNSPLSDLGLDTVDQVVELQWKDTLAYLLGIEYRFSERIALRAGYAIGSSTTPDTAASPFMPPPGPLQQVTAGVGLHLGKVDLDFGAAYAFGSADVEEGNPNGAAGHYEVDAFFLSVSGSYGL